MLKLVSNLTIVGSGAAAVIILHHLINLKSNSGPINITIIGDQAPFGVGTAYATTEESHLLNLTTEMMSIPGEESFPGWLRKTYPMLFFDKVENSYISRYYFGQYINHIFNKLIEEAKIKSISVNLVKDRVINITYQSKVFTLTTQFKQQFISQQIVLCIGHQSPACYRDLIKYRNYIHYPWPFKDCIKKLNSNATVAIIGSRLSAIDVALGLAAHNHNGLMYLVSRNGQLPYVKTYLDKYHLEILTSSKIKALYEQYQKSLGIFTLKKLLCKELRLAYQCQKNIIKCPYYTDAISWLKEEIQRLKSPSIWQNVLEALYQIASDIWQYMDTNAQHYFMEYYFTQWMRKTASFPLDNAVKILQLVKTNKLKLIGGLKDISFDNNLKQFRLSLENNLIINIDAVINATGSNIQIPKCNDLLIQQLYQDNVITPHPLGGVKVSPDTMLVLNNKKIPLYILGELTLGAFLTVNDFPMIGNQAKRAAIKILQDGPI